MSGPSSLGEFISGGGGRKLKLVEAARTKFFGVYSRKRRNPTTQGKEKVIEYTDGVVGIQKRKVGRPKGSKNWPKVGAMQVREGYEVSSTRVLSRDACDGGGRVSKAAEKTILEQMSALGKSKESFVYIDLTREEDVVTYTYSTERDAVFTAVTRVGGQRAVLRKLGDVSYNKTSEPNEARSQERMYVDRKKCEETASYENDKRFLEAYVKYNKIQIPSQNSSLLETGN